MVEPQQANEALQLRELLFEDADDTPPSTGMRRHRLSKPLTTGALVTMMSIVLASRLGSNAGLGVLFGLFFGVIAFLILRLQES